MTAQEILKGVCAKWSITEEQLKSKSRQNVLVMARIEAAKILHRDLNLSYPSIGIVLGGRNNSTVRSYFKNS